MVDRRPREWDAPLRQLRENAVRTFEPKRVSEAAVIQSVTRDEKGLPLRAVARLGTVDVAVELRGAPVRVGQAVLLSRAVGQAANPDYQFAGYLDSLTPFPSLDDDLTIPAPTWAATPLTTSVVSPHAGGQHAVVTVHFRETPERYAPAYVEVSWRVNGGAWASTNVANTVGDDADHLLELPAALPLGASVDVALRTYVASGARSGPTDTRTIIAATDTTTPAAPTFTVDVSNNLTAVITISAPSQPLVFDHYEVAISDTAGGAGEVIGTTRTTQYVHTEPAAQDIYVRVREVTRTGVAGPWSNGGTRAGPYHLAPTEVQLDTTPPPAPQIAAVSQEVRIEQGQVVVDLVITLAAYTPPSDFAEFQLRIERDDGAPDDFRSFV